MRIVTVIVGCVLPALVGAGPALAQSYSDAALLFAEQLRDAGFAADPEWRCRFAADGVSCTTEYGDQGATVTMQGTSARVRTIAISCDTAAGCSAEQAGALSGAALGALEGQAGSYDAIFGAIGLSIVRPRAPDRCVIEGRARACLRREGGTLSITVDRAS